MGVWTPGPNPGTGNDTFVGDATGEAASGGAGADTLLGNDGNDVLYGHSDGANGFITSTAAITGLAAPVAGAPAFSDPGFLYIVEKNSGIIWRADPATGQRTVFLDIPNGEFNAVGERGVLGIAFHPTDANRFFVYLTEPDGNIQVRQYTRSADPTVASTSFTVVMEIDRPSSAQSNHNGGWIGFSPTDGFLYIAVGDGGGGGDPFNTSQDINNLNGKMLRIDVNGDDFPGDAVRNYAIPASNPFVGVSGADEVWAVGLRNPWRNAFDPRNGDFYIADVGQSALEEVNFLATGSGGGANFGWSLREGTQPYPPGSTVPPNPAFIDPIFEYARDLGVSISGGEVYVGSAAGFVGQYVFADFGSGRIWSLSVADGVAVGATVRNAQIVGPTPTSVVDFVTGTDGALYAIGIGGTLWRLDPGAGAEDLGDTLNGGGGNDRLIGGAGNDTLIGGAGIDTASYAVSSANATWVRSVSGAWTVTSAQGADAVTSVEFLDFTDRDVVLDIAQQTFSGDGTSDILWRNTSGLTATWAILGTAQSGSSVIGSVGTDWIIAGTGDFSGDGRDDILWQRNDGLVYIWNDASSASAAFVAAASTAWSIQGVGDFDFDGRDDFLWRNDSSGQVAIWGINGSSVATQSVIGAAGLEWSIVANADFNGDGRDEILWRRNDGLLANWETNGSAQTGSSIVGSVGTEWSVVGTGDFDGDGRADILWQRDDGLMAIWRMNGATQLGAEIIGGVGTTWDVADVGDYNGDGRDDIFWRSDSGLLAVWTMNGFTVTATGITGSVGSEWDVIGGG